MWLSNVNCIYVSQLLYPFICQWASRLLPYAGCCNTVNCHLLITVSWAPGVAAQQVVTAWYVEWAHWSRLYHSKLELAVDGALLPQLPACVQWGSDSPSSWRWAATGWLCLRSFGYEAGNSMKCGGDFLGWQYSHRLLRTEKKQSDKVAQGLESQNCSSWFPMSSTRHMLQL